MVKHSLELLKSHACFDGEMRFYKFSSEHLHSETKFGVFLPKSALEGVKALEAGKKIASRTPYIMALAGLTCTEETFLIKSNAIRFAAQNGIAIVASDTSPRDCGLDAKSETYWLGEGAGYYINATKEPWNKHYNMHSYIAEELPAVVAEFLGLDDNNKSITGHSMGGMGAIMLGLKYPQAWKSVSAFSPVVNPTGSDWGTDAGSCYFNNPDEWKDYSPVMLLDQGYKHPNPILIDQGMADDFLSKLQPDTIIEAAKKTGQQVILHKRDGYDHSYWFIQTFIESHIAYHSLFLNKSA